MRTTDFTVADMDRRRQNSLHIQYFHQLAHRRDIRDGVHGSHFMEVDFRHRSSMGLRLRRRNQLIDLYGVMPHRLRQRQRFDDMRDIIHGTVDMRM